MIRLTVKGRKPESVAELARRNIAPLMLDEEKSQCLTDFYTCRIIILDTKENAQRVHDWWLDTEVRLPGEGFKDGSLMMYSVGNG